MLSRFLTKYWNPMGIEKTESLEEMGRTLVLGTDVLRTKHTEVANEVGFNTTQGSTYNRRTPQGIPNSTIDNWNTLNNPTLDKASYYQTLSSLLDIDYIEQVLTDVKMDFMTLQVSGVYDFLTIESSNEKLKEKAEVLLRKYKLVELLDEDLIDLLLFGQVIYSINPQNYEIDDTLNQSNYLEVISRKENKRFIHEKSPEVNEIISNDNFLVITINTSHKKTIITTEDNKKFTSRLPKGIIPLSIIPKIQSLKLLEKLQPITELQAIDEKMYMYIRFPQGQSVSSAFKEVRAYERFLEDLIGTETPTTIDDVIKKASKIKVIPLFGDKNTLQPETINKINRIDIGQINDLRDSISNALKVSFNSENKLPYLKLIKFLRHSVSNSLTLFIKTLLQLSSDNNFTDDELDTLKVLLPPIKGIAELEELDFNSLYSELINGVGDTISKITETIDGLEDTEYINKEIIVDYFNIKMKPLINTDLIDKEFFMSSKED